MTQLKIAISGPVASGKTILLNEIKNFLSLKYEVSEIQEKASLEGFVEQILVDFEVSNLNTEKYMFENRPIGNMTWLELQEASSHGSFACTKERDVEKAGAVYKLRDPTTEEVCYVFCDEAEQFSNPYRTAEEAATMSRKYADNL